MGISVCGVSDDTVVISYIVMGHSEYDTLLRRQWKKHESKVGKIEISR